MKTGLIAALTLAALAGPALAADLQSPPPEATVYYVRYDNGLPPGDPYYAFITWEQFRQMPYINNLMADVAGTKPFLVKKTDQRTACRWAIQTAARLASWAEQLTPEAGTQPKGIDDIVSEFAKAPGVQRKKALLLRTADQLEEGCEKDAAGAPPSSAPRP